MRTIRLKEYQRSSTIRNVTSGLARCHAPQHLDSRQVYGYITFGEDDAHYVEDGLDRARALLRDDLAGCGNGAAVPGPSLVDRALTRAPPHRSAAKLSVPARDSASALPPMHVINLDRSP